jgi:hypothetical protein
VQRREGQRILGITLESMNEYSPSATAVKVPLGGQIAPITVDVPSRQNCQMASADPFVVLP